MGRSSRLTPARRRRLLAMCLVGMLVGGFLVVGNSLKMWLVQATVLDAFLQIAWTIILVNFAYQHAQLRSQRAQGDGMHRWAANEPARDPDT